MEENKPDSRIFVALFLMLGFFFTWNYFFPMTSPPKKPATQEAVSQSAPTVVVSPLPPEQEFTIKSEHFTTTLSSHGGAIKSWIITDKQYATDGKLLDLIPKVPDNFPKPWPGQISFESAIGFSIPGETLPFERVTENGDEDGSVRLRWISSDKTASLDKYFYLNAQGDGLELKVTLKNLSSQNVSARMVLNVDGYQDPEKMEGEGFWIFRSPADLSNPACYLNDSLKHLYFAKTTTSEGGSGEVSWVGVNRTYFIKTFFPQGEVGKQLSCTVSTKENGEVRAALVYPPSNIGPGSEETRSLGIYFGPKKTDFTSTKLNDAETSASLEGATDYGAWFGWLVKPLAVPMLWLLKIFYGWVGNWGLAIVLLTIAVRLITLWPSHKAFKSMQGMAALKPQLDALREKYKDDQQGFAQAQMALMRASGVNPLGGCLPLLLQMPFFWGLYTMIYNAVEIYRAPFGLWITDLSIADPYFILPLLTGFILWVNQKLTPTTMDPAQARMMNWLMPGMMTLFMLFLPSGLVVYTITSMLFGIAQQYALKRAYPTPPPETPKKDAGDDRPKSEAKATPQNKPSNKPKKKR